MQPPVRLWIFCVSVPCSD